MPVPRTRDALDVLVDNVRTAQATLPVPLALENIAALLEWPRGELSEGQFLAELVERTDCLLLIDVANLHAHAVLPEVLDLLDELHAGVNPPGVLLERDDNYPSDTELAAAQADLLRALLTDGEVPEGFHPKRLRVEANALLNKRRGVAALLRPDIVDALGDRFRPLFDTCARAHPRASGSPARDDTAAFAERAAVSGELPTPTPPRRRWWRKR